MRHIHGLRRRGGAGLCVRGMNGKVIRQHLTSAFNKVVGGSGVIARPVALSQAQSIAKRIKSTGSTYMPLKFRLN